MSEYQKHINSVILSGVIKKAFDQRTLDSGDVVQTYALSFKNGDKDREVSLNVYVKGEYAEDDVRLDVDEGASVVVQGSLNEQRWQDKETKEWHGRHEVRVDKLVNVSELEDDDPFGDDE